MTTLLHIIAETPRWVVVLFLLLLALGSWQLRDRRVQRARLAVLPVAMAGFSIYGVASDFGVQPALVIAWSCSAVLALAAVLRKPLHSAARYEATPGTIHVPGSALPLILMMALFALKYVVAVTLIMHPSLRHALGWTIALAAVYGGFTGLFAGRALRLGWRPWLSPHSARKTL